MRKNIINFYVYLWLHEDGVPYYVGKGSGRRAFEKHSIGTRPEGRVIIRDAFNEQEAFEIEEFLIRLYGRLDLGTGPLCNLSFGGYGGASGAIRSSEFRQKISQAMRGNKHAQGHQNALGHKPSAESIRKRSEALKGNKHTLGHILSEEHKRKISEGLKNRFLLDR